MSTNLSQKMGELATKVKNGAERYSPQISAGLGIACFLFAIYKAVKVTPEADKALEEKRKEMNMKKLPVVETVKTAGKFYIVPAVSAAAGTACVINCAVKGEKRFVATYATYELWRNAAEETRLQLREQLGEKKAQKIQDGVNQKEITENAPVQSVNIFTPKEDGSHKTLFYEPITNRYFWERREKVEIAIANAYKSQDIYDEISAYDWLKMLPAEIFTGMKDASIDMYMNMGWPRTTPSEGFHVDIVAGGIVTDGEYEGYPCLELQYDELPAPYFRPFY